MAVRPVERKPLYELDQHWSNSADNQPVNNAPLAALARSPAPGGEVPIKP